MVACATMPARKFCSTRTQWPKARLPYLQIRAFVVSDNDSLLLYSTDTTGFGQYRLYLKDLRTGAIQGPLAERVTSVVWAADNATLFYVTEHPVTKRSDTVWRLRLGREPVKLYEEMDELFDVRLSRTRGPQVRRSPRTIDRHVGELAAPG